MAASKKSYKKTSKKTDHKRKKTSPARGKSPMAREITFLILFVFGILCLLSVFHVCGILGEWLCGVLFGLIGALAYIFPVYLIVASGLYISNDKNRALRRKVLFSIGLFFSLCGLFQWVVNDPVNNVWEIYTVSSENQGGGGFLGGLLAFELARVVGRAGSFIIILALIVLFFMLISGKLFFTSLKGLYDERSEQREYTVYEEEVPTKPRHLTPYTFENKDGQSSEKKNSPALSKKKAAREAAQEAAQAEKIKSIQPEDGQPEKKTRRTRKSAAMVEVNSSPENPLDHIHIIGGEPKPEQPESTIYKEELEQKFGHHDATAVESQSFTENNAFSEGMAPDGKAAPGQKAARKEIVSEKKAAAQNTDEKNALTEKDKQEMDQVQKDLEKAAVTEIPYQFPPLGLLTAPKGNRGGTDHNELKATAMKLQQTLESFGVRVKLGDISLGPSVTRYELIPEQGVKVSRITSLSDDIKLSLAASDIRIEAPIPGKAAVGIEVPNPERTMITLRELLESNEFKKAKSRVTFAVGKDISGQTIVTDIAKMPHLLIAGATGSGKSVLINTLIMSIIYKASPNEVKMIMVDPKMVELTAYEDIPHLMIPVVKDPKKASAALAWAVAEMTNRYQKFADAGVRDLASYNARIDKVTDKSDPEYQKMPQIVIIVDEFADLMMVAPGEVEDAVCRLAQLARAAGIHLVLATQRPSVNVITGLIKANIPSRIALSVSSAVDSRTIIDSAGAEKLLGNGDMLFAPQNLPKPIRVQGAFVSDEERDGVVSFLKNQGGPAYNSEVTAHIESAPVPGAQNGAGANGSGSGSDELFAEAGRFIIEKDKASIGLLQRMFRIGFNRAARIMDQLSDAGVVGPEEGTKARQILMSKEQFENYLEENGG